MVTHLAVVLMARCQGRSGVRERGKRTSGLSRNLGGPVVSEHLVPEEGVGAVASGTVEPKDNEAKREGRRGVVVANST
jgi:hypothetical protein